MRNVAYAWIMMRESLNGLVMAGMLLLAACAAPAQHAPAPSGDDAASRWRAEPVVFNGRRYLLSFRPLGRDVHDARLAAPGRALGGGVGDARVVREVVEASLRHFTCRDSQLARVEQDSMRHVRGIWRMRVRCHARRR